MKTGFKHKFNKEMPVSVWEHPATFEMDALSALADFFAAIYSDPRINSTHICMYAALIQYRNLQKTCPVLLSSVELMRMAKISSGKTYYKCLKELDQYGYLRYEPSFNRNEKSRVYIPVNKFTLCHTFQNKF